MHTLLTATVAGGGVDSYGVNVKIALARVGER